MDRSTPSPILQNLKSQRKRREKFYFSSPEPEEKANTTKVIEPEPINEETFVIEKRNVQNETFATEVTEKETKLEKSNVSDTSSIGMGKITPHHPWLEMRWRKELPISKEEQRFEILAPHFESLKQLVPCLRENSKENEISEMTVKYIKFIQEQAGPAMVNMDIEFLKNEITRFKK